MIGLDSELTQDDMKRMQDLGQSHKRWEFRSAALPSTGLTMSVAICASPLKDSHTRTRTLTCYLATVGRLLPGYGGPGAQPVSLVGPSGAVDDGV